MENSRPLFSNSFTFDDILLVPGYTDFLRSDIHLETKLTKHITLSLPLVAAPMDTVTESALAIALAELGGIGIIHRNLAVIDQADQVHAVRKKKLLVGAAVGASSGFEQRVESLVKAGVSVLLVDAAHGYAKPIIEAVKYIKTHFSTIDVIAGNIATAEGAEGLIGAGADGLRVGMGPGAICTTRIISGMGVPQVTALLETSAVAKRSGVPVMADGGIKYSGDMVKALALGAHCVMMGSFFAAASESPGKTIELPAQVPQLLQQLQYCQQ